MILYISSLLPGVPGARNSLFAGLPRAGYAGGTGRSTPPSKYDAETAKIMAAAGLDPEKD